jgi:hypothetical protein
MLPWPRQGPSASVSEIRSAFRRELLKYHPDVISDAGWDPEAAAQVGAANETVGPFLHAAWISGCSDRPPSPVSFVAIVCSTCQSSCKCAPPHQRTRALYDAYACLRDPKKVRCFPLVFLFISVLGSLFWMSNFAGTSPLSCLRCVCPTA